eukprot:403352130
MNNEKKSGSAQNRLSMSPPVLKNSVSQKVVSSASSKFQGGEIGGNAVESKRLLTEGKRYMYGRNNYHINFDLAYQLFNEAIAKDPSNSEAFQLRGKCKMEMKDYQNAQFDFTMALKLDKNDKKKQAEHLNLAGQAMFYQGKLEEALAQFDKAIKIERDVASHFYFRAMVKQKVNRTEEAIEDFRKAIEKGLNDQNTMWHAFHNKGQCLRKLGRTDEAIIDFKKAVELQGDRSVGLDNLGMALFDKQNYEEALFVFGRAISIDSEPAHYSHRGIAFFQLGKYEEALNDFHMAISKQEDEPLFYYQRGNVYLSLSRYDDAHSDYDRAIDLDQSNPKYWHAKGLAFEGQQSKLLGNQGMDLRHQAIRMYEKALFYAENDFISSEFHLGKMLHLTNQFQEGLKRLSNVVSKIPDDIEVYIQRGQVYQDMGNHQFAVKDFNKALELNSEKPEAFYYRGISKMKSKLYYEALEDFQRSKNLIENEEDQFIPGILDGQGCCFLALQDYDKAITYFNQAINLQPQNIKFLMNRSNCFYTLKNFKEAISDIDSALVIQPKDPQILYKLGLAYYNLPNYKRCIKSLKKALKNNPYISYEADIYYHIGIAYSNLDKFERSLYPLSKCIEMIPNDIRYIHERAKSYQMIQFHKEAIEDFSNVIRRNPKNAHAYFRRAFSYKAVNNFQQAADDFEKAKELDPLNPRLVVNYKKLKGINCIVLCLPGNEKAFM